MKNIYKKHMTILKTIFAFSFVYLIPSVTFAAGKDLKYLIGLFTEYLNIGIELIIAMAVIYFIYNVFNYFFKADLENKKEAGLYVMYSIIGFFIILSFWGMVNLLKNTFNLDNAKPTGLNFNDGITDDNTIGK